MSWPAIGLLGGVIGLDATSFPQIMLSRPLVAGTLTGVSLGNVTVGAGLGALHEIFNLAVLPVGASRYPEAGTATVAAVAALLLAPTTSFWPALLLALVFALLWERVMGASVVSYRRTVERIVSAPDGGTLDARMVERRHAMAMALDFTRAALLTLLGAAVGLQLLTLLLPYLQLPELAVRNVLAVAAAAVLGGSLGMFGGWSARRASFLIGAATGSVLLALLR